MLTFVDVKFISIARVYREALEDKGPFRSANILQIANVVRRVVLLLFLLCFKTVVRDETSLLATKTIQTRCQVFSVNGSIICQLCCTIDVINSIWQNSFKFGRQ